MVKDFSPHGWAFWSGIDSLSATARTDAYHLALKDVGPFIVIEQDVNPRGRICSRRRATEVIHK